MGFQGGKSVVKRAVKVGDEIVADKNYFLGGRVNFRERIHFFRPMRQPVSGSQNMKMEAVPQRLDSRIERQLVSSLILIPFENFVKVSPTFVR